MGRKVGFVLGNSIGLFGTWVALQGLESASLYLFACGTWLIGIAIGVGQQYRFAALDLCSVANAKRNRDSDCYRDYPIDLASAYSSA